MAASAAASAADFGRGRAVSASGSARTVASSAESRPAEVWAHTDGVGAARHPIAASSSRVGLCRAVLRLDFNPNTLEERGRQNTSSAYDNGIVFNRHWLTRLLKLDPLFVDSRNG